MRKRGFLCSMSKGGLAHPRALFVSLLARAHALSVARAVTLDHLEKLVPVDGSDVVVAARVVPLKLWIRNGEAQVLGLLDRLVDELLPQLVVTVELDFPAHRLGAVDGGLVGWTEHHDRWPPPAIQGVLRHRLLLWRAAGERHHVLVALTLVEAFLL